MATFPKLKTGAVMQYPAAKSLRFTNDAVKFLDGTEQRYRGSASALRQWTIRLDLVDEGELAAIGEFFLENQGAFANFSFVDPWDGVEYANCSVQGDIFEFLLKGEMHGQASVVVQQNRS